MPRELIRAKYISHEEGRGWVQGEQSVHGDVHGDSWCKLIKQLSVQSEKNKKHKL